MPSSSPTVDRPDRSMALLADLARDAQDPAYAEAARRRAAAGQPAGGGATGRAGHVGMAVSLALLGLLTGVAASTVRAGASDSREDLAAEVRARTGQSDALQRQATSLRRDVAARRDQALIQGAAGRQRARQLAALELAAGTVAARGPGAVVVLADRPPDAAPAAVPRGGRPGDGRVADRDLQDLVNGLWAAGAEAVSVNDQRLTARTAIRSAGEAILVDLRPLSPPYTVRAIGPPGLAAAFRDGDAGRALATYATLAGLGLSVTGAPSLTLPAGAPPEPRAVQLPAPGSG